MTRIADRSEVALTWTVQEQEQGFTARLRLRPLAHSGTPLEAQVHWQLGGAPPVLDGAILLVLHWCLRHAHRLHVEGTVSPTFIENLVDLQEHWSHARPGELHPFALSAETAVLPPRVETPHMLAAFSGGVDSTHTALRHSPMHGSLPGRRVSHLVFVHGADIPYNESPLFDRAVARIAPIATYVGCQIATVRSDIRHAVPQDWEMSHGAQLAGLMHLLSGVSDTALIPSSYTFSRFPFPWGSSPILDHFHSGSMLRARHDAGAYSRFDKIRDIARHPAVLPYLRVYWQGADLSKNCGRCRKCINTRLMLLACGASDEAFGEPIDNTLVRRVGPLPPEALASLQQAHAYAMTHDTRLTVAQRRALLQRIHAVKRQNLRATVVGRARLVWHRLRNRNA